MKPVRIATRKSALALWQANHVAALIRHASPSADVSLVELTTAGDRFLQAPLSQVGGKGLFIKEIEEAVLVGRADLAVHSLKDVTSQLAPGLCLAAVPEREDPRDAFVSPQGLRLAEVPPGGRVGTSSLRRTCQLRERRPDLVVENLRGNVQTRLEKTAASGMAGAVLALAGLRRLGLEASVTEVLEPEVSLPAVGQGALAIECREGDLTSQLGVALRRLDDPVTRLAVTAERGFLSRLEGGCTVPLAAFATVREGRIRLRGLVGRPDGTRIVRGECSGDLPSPFDGELASGALVAAERMGVDLAEELLRRGAAEILAEFAGRGAPPES